MVFRKDLIYFYQNLALLAITRKISNISKIDKQNLYLRE